MEEEARNALEAASIAIGCPWYIEMLRESGEKVDASSSELAAFARSQTDGESSQLDDWCASAMTLMVQDCGVSERDAGAIIDEALKAVKRSHRVETKTHGDARDVIRNTHGGIFNPTFLDSIEPLYDLHMGAENMGPLLYTLARFSKPKNILEIGAGYTSIFLLQALEDNAEEGRRYSHMISDGKAMIGDVPWVVKDYEFDRLTHSTLHIVDNCAHEHTTAHRVDEIAQRLGCRDRLRVHVTDAFASELPSTLAIPEAPCFDMLWIDLGAAHRIAGFFDAWWSRVNPEGGLVIVHSTLTNALSRQWLEDMRRLAKNGGRDSDGTSPYGGFTTMSFLEPHKMFQNSCSIFQKRGDALSGDWTERILTKYP